MGYSKEDIKLLEKYRYTDIKDIPREVLNATGAKCAKGIQKMNHIFRWDTTRASVRATWAWDKAPLVQKEDKLAFAWSGDFLPIFSESIIKIEHINENGVVLGREEKGRHKESPGQGYEFTTLLAPYLGRTRGAAYVALEMQI